MASHREQFHRHMVFTMVISLFALMLACSQVDPTQRVATGRMGQVVDWSTNHILYPRGATSGPIDYSDRDPRAYWSYLKMLQGANGSGGGGEVNIRGPHPKRPSVSAADWSVSLGAAGLAANMYPSKYSFNINAAPDCTNDFVVYTLNTAPGATQANIVAFNNLYSGSAGGTGICGPGTATVMWAYQVSTFVLRTSPLISLDGTKIAFVDGNTPAVFHVLTPTAGEGNVTAPATPTAGEIVNLPLTTGADTDSSPFIDYANDVAYVGTNNGRMFKITGVFRGTPALAGAPWPIRVATGQTTEPVLDFNSGNLIFGSANGLLYGFTPTGTPIPGSPMVVGDGTANGGIKDAPVLDEVNGFVYAETGGNGSATAAVMVQTGTTDFTTAQTAVIGASDAAPIHGGAFNDAYFSSPTNMIGTTSEWFYYVCGNSTGGSAFPVLYRVGFNASRQMNATVDAAQLSLSANAGEQCSPLTEFRNGIDRLFLGLRMLHVVESFDISSNLVPTTAGGPLAEAGGTSGIIVDNVSTANQASSIYFSTIGASANCKVAGVNQRCAVKLTQAALQ